jgi:hypothetical protein
MPKSVLLLTILALSSFLTACNQQEFAAAAAEPVVIIVD